MAKQTISSSQLHAINSGALDLLGTDSVRAVTKFDDLAMTLQYLGGVYAQKLTEYLNKADASSSGNLSDSIIPLDVTIFGSQYTVEIQAAKYAKFIDEGVSGWNKDRGSKYKFKTKGVDPKGEMVKSIKAWLLREGTFIRLGQVDSKREKKQNAITDATTRTAISAAYMIKRQGIKPTHFWRDATKDMTRIVETELAKALKVDIINNITVQ